jgi:hypothetical protein
VVDRKLNQEGEREQYERERARERERGLSLKTFTLIPNTLKLQIVKLICTCNQKLKVLKFGIFL